MGAAESTGRSVGGSVDPGIGGDGTGGTVAVSLVGTCTGAGVVAGVGGGFKAGASEGPPIHPQGSCASGGNESQ